jgi:hypothetical protein
MSLTCEACTILTRARHRTISDVIMDLLVQGQSRVVPTSYASPLRLLTCLAWAVLGQTP